MTTPHPTASGYSERLGVPASWWIVALGVGVTTVVAMGLYLDPWLAAAFAVLATAAMVAALLGYGRRRVAVDERGLWVGPSLLEWAYQGETVALDAAATRERLGPKADARAFVATRPYVREAVAVEVADPADPHPYWIVSTRRPQRLLTALEAGRERAGVRG